MVWIFNWRSSHHGDLIFMSLIVGSLSMQRMVTAEGPQTLDELINVVGNNPQCRDVLPAGRPKRDIQYARVQISSQIWLSGMVEQFVPVWHTPIAKYKKTSVCSILNSSPTGDVFIFCNTSLSDNVKRVQTVQRLDHYYIEILPACKQNLNHAQLNVQFAPFFNNKYS